MKTVIRTFALAMVVAGAIATNMTSAKAALHPSATAMSSMPVPTCPLNDPKGCGIDKM